MYSLEDVAEMCKTSPEKVSTVYFDGVEYFRGESKSVVNTDGTVVSVTVTSLVCIDNGWMYMFQFNGTGGDKLYSDFVSLIKSVKYSAGSSASDNTPSESNDVYVIAGVVLLAVAVIIGVIVRRKKKAKKLEKLLDYGSPAPQPQAAAKQRVVCKNCGLVLPPDSVFCHMCGTKIGKQ